MVWMSSSESCAKNSPLTNGALQTCVSHCVREFIVSTHPSCPLSYTRLLVLSHGSTVWRPSSNAHTLLLNFAASRSTIPVTVCCLSLPGLRYPILTAENTFRQQASKQAGWGNGLAVRGIRGARTEPAQCVPAALGRSLHAASPATSA